MDGTTHSSLIPPAAAAQRWQRVSADRRFRGLRVEENLLAAYTMYVVELDQLGLFISDSRAAALDMAFDALCGQSTAAC